MSWHRNRLHGHILCGTIALSACAFPFPPHAASQAISAAAVQQGFMTPPSTARPMVRWWWFGPAVEKPEILRELQQMKADGIGGAELAFVYAEVVDDPNRSLKNFRFLSPEMLDAVNYAQLEGRKLGLRIDVTLGSGWPYGGPATTLDEAATRLRMIAAPIHAGDTSVSEPALKPGETILYSAVANGTPEKWDATTAKPIISQPGKAPFSASDAPRVALFFIQSHTGQQVKRASVGAEGWVLDPFSKQAVATHLKEVGEPLVKAFGSTPPYAVFSDSLEAYGADWTPNLPAEFRKRRGYDLIPHLPELVAGGSPAADKVRHDWGRTLTELVDENYLTQINDWAKAHNTKFRSQTYGEPAVTLSSQRLVALPEGEGPQWRAFSTLRWATSGNHVFGNNITTGETFTWLHSPVFRATPLDMKAEADIDFIMGENKLIFHGWPYSAPQAGEPGWSLYAAASFNDHNPWHPVMPTVTSYIARLSYLMQQGKPANQVAVLLPTDDAWASFEPGKVTVSGAMQKLLPRQLLGTILSSGYNFDFTDANAIERLGVQHPILVVPPTDRIPMATLRKIEAYQATGGKVIAIGRSPSIDPEGKSSAEFSALAKKLFGNELVPDAPALPQALHLAATPNLHAADSLSAADHDALGFIRRNLGTGDIYLLVNTSNREIRTTVSLASKYSSGVQLDPDTGRTLGSVKADSIPVTLAPYESRAYLFGAGLAQPQTKQASDKLSVADLTTDWSVRFLGIGKSSTEHSLTDWTADPSTVHYSGEATYSRTFMLTQLPTKKIYLEVDGGTPEPGAPNSPPEQLERAKYNLLPDGMPNPLVTGTGPGMHAYYEPPVREGALVTINGQKAGALWHPPYRLDVTKLLKPGENRIEIHVFNTALNAWSALPPHDYKPLIAKYGDRFQMQDLNKVKPISSGLLGSIHLVSQEPE